MFFNKVIVFSTGVDLICRVLKVGMPEDTDSMLLIDPTTVDANRSISDDAVAG